MDMFNKLKAKLAEELDSESERDDRGGAGAASSTASHDGQELDARALQQEVLELKEHINKNYFVYVRRLEKRKERIRELEEYAKLLGFARGGDTNARGLRRQNALWDEPGEQVLPAIGGEADNSFNPDERD